MQHHRMPGSCLEDAETPRCTFRGPRDTPPPPGAHHESDKRMYCDYLGVPCMKLCEAWNGNSLGRIRDGGSWSKISVLSCRRSRWQSIYLLLDSGIGVNGGNYRLTHQFAFVWQMLCCGDCCHQCHLRNDHYWFEQ